MVPEQLIVAMDFQKACDSVSFALRVALRHFGLPVAYVSVLMAIIGGTTDWGADDEVLEKLRPKNASGRAEQTHKSQTAP